MTARTYDELLLMFCMAGVPWEEACRLAREFATTRTSHNAGASVGSKAVAA